MGLPSFVESPLNCCIIVNPFYVIIAAKIRKIAWKVNNFSKKVKFFA